MRGCLPNSLSCSVMRIEAQLDPDIVGVTWSSATRPRVRTCSVRSAHEYINALQSGQVVGVMIGLIPIGS